MTSAGVREWRCFIFAHHCTLLPDKTSGYNLKRGYEMETWEQILLGVFALLLVLWFFPGIKPMLEKSKQAPKDWPGLLIPIALVVVLVIFLAATM